jgi:RNA polymerase sigma-70 factor (ECF subfamily)
MPWVSTLPNVVAVEASPAADQPLTGDAFAGFYQRSASSLWAYLARVSGDAALADDLMQESFVRFLSATVPEGGEVAARRYLFRIGANLLHDHWRRPRTTSVDELPAELFSADARAQSDSQLLLGPVLKQLRPRDRELLWLAHAEGYSHHEIARITGLGSTSIRLLLFRARRKAAALLRKQAEGGIHER